MEMLLDRRTDNTGTNEQKELQQFRNLAMMMIYLPVKFFGKATRRLCNVAGQTNGQYRNK